MSQIDLNSLSYENINIALIDNIKDKDEFLNVINIWKRGVNGHYMDFKICTIKNTIYQHYLYPKCKLALELWLINHLY